jgi:hypothetical protein
LAKCRVASAVVVAHWWAGEAGGIWGRVVVAGIREAAGKSGSRGVGRFEPKPGRRAAALSW